MIFHGTNVRAPWYKHWCAKDFRMVCQRLWLILRKTLVGQMLYHGAYSIVPSGIIHCTMRRGAINGIAPHKKKDLTFRVKSFFL